jgi:hypothetical protein
VNVGRRSQPESDLKALWKPNQLRLAAWRYGLSPPRRAARRWRSSSRLRTPRIDLLFHDCTRIKLLYPDRNRMCKGSHSKPPRRAHESPDRKGGVASGARAATHPLGRALNFTTALSEILDARVLTRTSIPPHTMPSSLSKKSSCEKTARRTGPISARPSVEPWPCAH